MQVHVATIMGGPLDVCDLHGDTVDLHSQVGSTFRLHAVTNNELILELVDGPSFAVAQDEAHFQFCVSR